MSEPEQCIGSFVLNFLNKLGGGLAGHIQMLTIKNLAKMLDKSKFFP